jgi:hypothetical protein
MTMRVRLPVAPGWRCPTSRNDGIGCDTVMLSAMAMRLLTLVVTLLLAGCATPRLGVDVDSIAAPSAPATGSFVVVPAAGGGDGDDLLFREFARLTTAALVERGFGPATSATEADLAIELAYGVGDPQQEFREVLEPGWPGRHVYDPWYRRPYWPGPFHDRRVESFTTYGRFVAVAAHESRGGEKGAQVWRTTAFSRGTGQDLRRLVPLMLAAAQPYFGRDTGGAVDVSVPADDPAVIRLKAAAADAGGE